MSLSAQPLPVPLPRLHRLPRLTVAWSSGLVGASAVGGGLAMLLGGLGMPPGWQQQLPLHSWTAGGMSLLLLVAGPQLSATWAAATDHLNTPLAAVTGGVLLIGFIGVELIALRQFSFLQPAMVAAGLVQLAAARALAKHPF